MDEMTKTNIKAYNYIAKEYIENTSKLEKPEIQIRKDFMNYLKKGDSILDVACGPGRDVKIFADNGFIVTGIDLSEKFLGKAKEVSPKSELQLMDIRRMIFKDSSFNGIWFNAGLVTIKKRDAPLILTSLYHALKKDGIMLISVKEGTGEGFELDERYDVKKYSAYYEEEELKELLQNANFTCIKTIRPTLLSKYHTNQWINIFCKK